MVTNKYVNWLLSLGYAFLFVYIIPWEELYGGQFIDVYSYVARISYLAEGRNESEYWGIKWLISEPLWKQILLFIAYAFEDYRAVVYFISFIVVSFYVSFLIKRVEFYIAMIFLLNPMMVDLFIAQIRIAVAFVLVLIAYDLVENNDKNKNLAIVLLIMAVFIHVSMPVFYMVYYLLFRLNQSVEDKKYYLIAIVTGVCIALFMKYGSNILLTWLGDRHAGYDEYISASSISYSIAWFIIAFIIGTFGNFSDKRKRVFVAYAIAIMSFFFFSSLLNVFAARYVAVIMPVIIIAIGYLPKHFKQGTYLFLFLYNIYAFKYWLQITIL